MFIEDSRKEYDVIIIGGGITGAATARDCALRGLKTLLVERGDLCDGASGRNHGLLHSGARYAVTDPEGARECISENRILRRIASSCIDPTGGLFITLPEDSLEYQEKFIKACLDCGIDAEAITPEEAIRMEPAVNPALIGAVKVPDASVDPFRLVDANILDAVRHGADVIKFREVTGLLKENGDIKGIQLGDTSIRARQVVIAAGIWSAHLAAMGGAHIDMMPSKGSLLIFGHRLTRMVINRCRKPGNADILVPGDVVSVLGTTSDKVPFEDCEDMKATADEVSVLLQEGIHLVPELSTTRIIRAYAGVRPLVVADSSASGRNVSRGIVLLDHEKRDGIKGLITITGGKLTTCRLMAEMATDLVCEKLGLKIPCTTATKKLPGSARRRNGKDPVNKRAAVGRHGSEADMMDFNGVGAGEIICECEQVTRAEIEYAVQHLGVRSISDLRRHTRVGMGTCQGSFCIRKVAKVLAEVLGTPDKAEELMNDYLQERWKGMAPVLWGDTLREADYMHKVHRK